MYHARNAPGSAENKSPSNEIPRVTAALRLFFFDTLVINITIKHGYPVALTKRTVNCRVNEAKRAPSRAARSEDEIKGGKLVCSIDEKRLVAGGDRFLAGGAADETASM